MASSNIVVFFEPSGFGPDVHAMARYIKAGVDIGLPGAGGKGVFPNASATSWAGFISAA
ncbi:MAG: hypothetical protein ACPHYE_03425 [Henriciella sp.]